MLICNLGCAKGRNTIKKYHTHTHTTFPCIHVYIQTRLTAATNYQVSASPTIYKKYNHKSENRETQNYIGSNGDCGVAAYILIIYFLISIGFFVLFQSLVGVDLSIPLQVICSKMKINAR